MARKPLDSDTEVRLRSSRAPYRRAGIEFGSIRETVTVGGDKLSADQLDRLRADPVIAIDLVDVETGKVTPIAAWEAAQAAAAEAAEAKARGKAERDAAQKSDGDKAGKKVPVEPKPAAVDGGGGGPTGAGANAAPVTPVTPAPEETAG